MTLNRAARRDLKRHLKSQVGRLAHPIPGSVVLRGGPMDGWMAKPDAPALEADWREKYLEEIARQDHEEHRQDESTGPSPSWDELSEQAHAAYRAFARAQHGAGRYVLRPDGQEADWVAEA